jgi:transcriptional regulator with XRE-family HTH domain
MKTKDLNEIQQSMNSIALAGGNEADRTQKCFLLAKKIEQAMKGNGLTRQSFAALMDVQPSIITRWLSGSHNFTTETLFDIEEKLRIKLLAIDSPVQATLNFHLYVSSGQTLLSNIKEMKNIMLNGPSVDTKTNYNFPDDIFPFLDFIEYKRHGRVNK